MALFLDDCSVSYQSIQTSVSVPCENDCHSPSQRCVLEDVHRRIGCDVKLWTVVIFIQYRNGHL